MTSSILLAALFAGHILSQEKVPGTTVLFSDGVPRSEVVRELTNASPSNDWSELLPKYGLREVHVHGTRCLIPETALGIGQLKAWAKIAQSLVPSQGETSSMVRSWALEGADRRSLELSVASFVDQVAPKPRKSFEVPPVSGRVSLSLALQFESPTRSVLLVLWPPDRHKRGSLDTGSATPASVAQNRLVGGEVPDNGRHRFYAETIGGLLEEVKFHRLVGAVTDQLVAEREEAYATTSTALRAAIQRYKEAYKEDWGEEVKRGTSTSLAALDEKLRDQIFQAADQRYASEGFKSAAEMRDFLSIAKLSRHRYYLKLAVAQPGTSNSVLSFPLADILIKP